jgi:hypothetical protein
MDVTDERAPPLTRIIPRAAAISLWPVLPYTLAFSMDVRKDVDNYRHPDTKSENIS